MRPTRFVGEVTFSALASEPVQRSLWDEDSPIPHTRLGQSADLIVVVPATAHLLGRYAAGLANDLLTATLLATRAPVMVCPAMHTEMWEHPAVVDNVALLERRGVTVVRPESGRLAGGDSGEGRLADPSVIVARALQLLAESGAGRAAKEDLAGRRIVVSAGGTREPIDPVRHITNRSSGKQGHALAEAAARRGATVTLVTASPLPVAGALSSRIDRVLVETAADMEAAMHEASPGADVIVMAAAVADFRPQGPPIGNEQRRRHPRHRARADARHSGRLGPTSGSRPGPGRFRGGNQRRRGARTQKARSQGGRPLGGQRCDQAGAGFDHDTNVVTILGADGSATEVPLMSKACSGRCRIG